jgi:hypothetical protein
LHQLEVLDLSTTDAKWDAKSRGGGSSIRRNLDPSAACTCTTSETVDARDAGVRWICWQPVVERPCRKSALLNRWTLDQLWYAISADFH